MSDWAVGDLAECMDNTPCDLEALAGLLVIGRIYRVYKTGIPEGGKRFCLAFNVPELVVGNSGYAYAATRFRKILPPKHEACEAEFVTLLKLSKRKVGA